MVLFQATLSSRYLHIVSTPRSSLLSSSPFCHPLGHCHSHPSLCVIPAPLCHSREGGNPVLNSYSTYNFTLTNAKRLQKKGAAVQWVGDNKVCNIRYNRGKISLFVIPALYESFPRPLSLPGRSRSSSLIPENYGV